MPDRKLTIEPVNIAEIMSYVTMPGKMQMKVVRRAERMAVFNLIFKSHRTPILLGVRIKEKKRLPNHV